MSDNTITQKFIETIETLNSKIEEQKKIQENEKDYSKKYQDSLKAQIKLEEKKLEFLKGFSK